jgi:REP element-mobilizing transposase RayT
VQLLVNFPPTVAISRLVNSLIRVSSLRLRQEFPDPRTMLTTTPGSLAGWAITHLRPAL